MLIEEVGVGAGVSGLGSRVGVLIFGELSAISWFTSDTAVWIRVSSGVGSRRKADTPAVGGVRLPRVWESICKTAGALLAICGPIVPRVPTAGNLIRLLPSMRIDGAHWLS